MTQQPRHPQPPHQPPPGQWAPPQHPQPAGHWGPPPMYWSPPPSTMPVEPVEYHQFWRAPGIAVWRPIVVVLLSAVAFFAFAVVATIAGVAVEMATGAVEPDELFALVEDGQVTPGLVLANSIAIGLLLPFSLLVARIVGQRPGFLHSVAGRFRWRWFWTCAAVSVGILAINFGVELWVAGTDVLDLRIHPYTWWLLVGLMLVTPFQAAAEEYLLRGVLLRTVASWFRRPVVAIAVGTIVNSALFMVMHGAADPWLNLLYFTLGALLSLLTWRTGGLEAAAAIHIANNMLAFSLVPFQDVSGLFDRSVGVAGPVVLWQVLAFAVVAVVLDALARRRGLQRRALVRG